MNLIERALTPETYTNALKDPGSAIKNVVSDPGFGLVAGTLLGMPQFGGFSAMQAALMTGGISALATGSLQKGFMTGLSAYGGAGLGASLSSAGQAALPGVGSGEVNPFANAGRTAVAASTPAAEASALDTISAGFKNVTSSPEAALQFAKDNYGKALMAAGPILADKMVATKTPLPTAGSLTGPSYIRPYSMTRKVRQPEKDSGSREQDWFETTWERGTPYKAANGGIVALAGGGTTSQDAYDFLMGKKSDTGSMVNTVTKAPTYEGRYEFDPATGTSRFVPARVDMTTAMKPIIPATTPTTPTTDTAGITTLVPGYGNPNAAAAQAAAFAAMTPAQKDAHQAQLAAINEGLTPIAVKVLQAIKNKILFKAPNEPPAPVHDMSLLSPMAIAEGAIGNATSAATNSAQGIAAANAAAAIGKANAAAGNAGSTGVSTGPGGMAGTTGQAGVAASVGAGNSGAASAAGPGSTGGGGAVGGASGMGGMGTGAAAAGVSAGVSGAGPGGVGGASGGNVRVAGGLSDLGSYSDGGRLLRGPGDGVSDSIPAMIGKNQPARLADGEFVVPARIVSEIGNGSTEAGARKLYAMMDRIQAARKKTVGKGKVAANTKTDKYLPA
jgi:hypothetical protein